jgi:hypothetical protein
MLKKFKTFVNEKYSEMIEVFNDIDILESIVTDTDTLLKTIEAEEIDIFTLFNLNKDKYDKNFNIEYLYDELTFNKHLNKNKLKKSEITSTEDNETFLEDTFYIKFLLIYKDNYSELEKPEYIIFQSKKKNKNWDSVKCYKVNLDMKNFYTKLTNKTVEIKKNDKIYIYNTSNGGNDWQLQKHVKNQEDKEFKSYMSNNDIKALLIDKNISIKILA